MTQANLRGIHRLICAADTEKINSNQYKKVNAVGVKQTRKQNLVFFYLQDCPGINNMNLLQYPFTELTYLYCINFL